MKNVCPRCNAEISQEKINVDMLTVPVIGCTECGGFLADYNEAENIMAPPPQNLSNQPDIPQELSSDADKELLGTCPICDSKFEHTVLEFELSKNSVHLDQCTGCNGIWFDKGEMQKIFGLAVKEAKLVGDIGDNLESITSTSEIEFTCPRCPTPEKASVGSIMGMDIVKCKKCNGIWLSGDQLENLIGEPQKIKTDGQGIKSSPEGSGEAGLCPTCKIKLSKWENKPQNLSELIVDYCNSCNGLWFDQGEFNSFFKIFSESPFQAYK